MTFKKISNLFFAMSFIVPVLVHAQTTEENGAEKPAKIKTEKKIEKEDTSEQDQEKDNARKAAKYRSSRTRDEDEDLSNDDESSSSRKKRRLKEANEKKAKLDRVDTSVHAGIAQQTTTGISGVVGGSVAARQKELKIGDRGTNNFELRLDGTAHLLASRTGNIVPVAEIGATASGTNADYTKFTNSVFPFLADVPGERRWVTSLTYDRNVALDRNGQILAGLGSSIRTKDYDGISDGYSLTALLEGGYASSGNARFVVAQGTPQVKMIMCLETEDSKYGLCLAPRLKAFAGFPSIGGQIGSGLFFKSKISDASQDDRKPATYLTVGADGSASGHVDPAGAHGAAQVMGVVGIQ